MSRAFIDESDDSLFEDDIPEIKDPLPHGVKNYMTRDGAERIKEELINLTKVERSSIATRISRAVADGGGLQKEVMLKERRRLREIDRRIDCRGVAQPLPRALEQLPRSEKKHERDGDRGQGLEFAMSIWMLTIGRARGDIDTDETDHIAGAIECRSRLGGLLNSYYREAA